jgi:hypothetical protein
MKAGKCQKTIARLSRADSQKLNAKGQDARQKSKEKPAWTSFFSEGS